MARQSRTPAILLTRPLLQSQRFAEQLRARWPEVEVVISPLMAPEYLQPDLPSRSFAALVLTSETGAEAARRISAAGVLLPALAYCVGDRTALAAQAAGFQTQSAQGDADALVAHIQAASPSGPLLLLRGADTTGNISERLHLAGFETVSAISYTQSPQPLSEAAVCLLRRAGPVVIPLFSPRSARIFSAQRLQSPTIALLWVAALSPAVAAAAADLVPALMRTAKRPDAAAMLDAIAALIADGMGS
jgi:uroporphyrinogen-III synthase